MEGSKGDISQGWLQLYDTGPGSIDAWVNSVTPSKRQSSEHRDIQDDVWDSSHLSLDSETFSPPSTVQQPQVSPQPHPLKLVVNPPVRLDQLDLLYEVVLETTLPIFDEPRSIAHRRYSHFAWLMRRLGTRIAPPPPLTTLPHSLEAIERQRKALQSVLKGLVENRIYQSMEILHVFIQSTTSESQLDWLVSIDGVHPRRQQHKHKHKHKHSKHAPISVPKAKKDSGGGRGAPTSPACCKGRHPKTQGAEAHGKVSAQLKHGSFEHRPEHWNEHWRRPTQQRRRHLQNLALDQQRSQICTQPPLSSPAAPRTQDSAASALAQRKYPWTIAGRVNITAQCF